MKIIQKINLAIIGSVAALIIVSITTSLFKEQELEYYRLVEAIKTLQNQVMNALVVQAQYEKNLSGEKKVFTALSAAKSTLKKNINADLLGNENQHLNKISSLLNSFEYSFQKMLDNNLIFERKKNRINELARAYSLKHDQISKKILHELANAVYIRSDEESSNLDPIALQEIKNTSLNAFSLINRIILLINQDLLQRKQQEAFLKKYRETYNQLSTEKENIEVQVMLVEGKEYNELSALLTHTTIEFKQDIHDLVELHHENQTISTQLANTEQQISLITGEITQLSETIRAQKSAIASRLNLLGQVLIILVLSIGGYLLGRSISKPLGILTLATEALNLKQIKDDSNNSITTENSLLSSKDEIGSLARSFHDMRNTIISQVDELHRMDDLKDMFLANTSHELRTPLNGIIGLSESLIDGAAGELNDTAQADLKMIADSGKRLSMLVNDLLDFSKIKNHDLQLLCKPVELHSTVDLVCKISSPLLAEKPVTITNQIPSDLPLLWADENRLEQILLNLVGNAVKFTHQGIITIKAQKHHSNQEQNSSTGSDSILIQVQDTGIGIPPKQQELIFNAFQQAHGDSDREYSGTGLGLSISKQLIELHGGTISVESEEGHGACFSFSIPISSDKHIPLEVNYDHSTLQTFTTHPSVETHDIADFPTSKANGVILVVDDEPVNVQVLKNQLNIQGYVVISAHDGFKALEIIEQTVPDLILLDLMMPRINGFEVCKRIRKDYSQEQLPILILTAKNQLESLLQGFLAGANDYMSKPFQKDELLARVATHLQAKKAVEAGKESLRLKVEISERQKRESEMKEYQHKLEQSNEEYQLILENLKQTQEQLIESRKMAALGGLVSGVAHEINTPLGISITGTSHLLEQNDKIAKAYSEEQLTAENFREFIQSSQDTAEMILNYLQKAAKLIQDFKQVAVAHSNFAKESFNLKEFLQITLSSLTPELKKNRPEITINCPNDLHLMSYPGAFSQILNNLVSNSILHGFKESIPGKIHINIEIREQQLIWTYSDNGQGIPEEHITKIFEPFFTTNRSSGVTGLGLHIVYNIVRQKLEGSIQCTSSMDKGTTFTIQIPLPESR